MSKTYKKPYCSMYRSPRGYKRAKLNNCRPKAIPCTSWDDQRVCDLVHRPFAVAKKLDEKGLDRETATKKLMVKFKLSYIEAEKIINDAYEEEPYFDFIYIKHEGNC